MRIIRLLLPIALAVILAGACAPAVTPTLPKKSGTIRFAYPTTPDTADVPSLLAQETLQAQGYTIEPTYFANPDVQVAAVAHGDADISHGSTRTHWAAVQKGAGIVTLMEQAANVWALVTRPDIRTCADLDGKMVGVNSAGSITNALLQAYVRQTCPTIHPIIVFVSGSDVRSAALQSGELDATLLELADVLTMEQVAPGKFTTLINFATALPKLKTNGIYATDTFARKHPDILRDYVRAVLLTHRAIRENPQLLYAGLVKYAKMDRQAAEQAGDAYLKNNIWDINGGLRPDDVAYSLDFFVQSGSIPAGLDPARITDTTFLETVLQEIGRR